MKKKKKLNEVFCNEILEFTKQKTYQPMENMELLEAMGKEEVQLEEFTDCLDFLVENGDILISKKGKIMSSEKARFLKGIFKGSAKGFGFITPDPIDGTPKQPDVYVAIENTNGAMQGDEVLYTVQESTRNFPPERRIDATVMRIAKRALTSIVGTVQSYPMRNPNSVKKYFVTPDDKKFSFSIDVANDKINGANEQDKVEVEFITYPASNNNAKGKITQVFGATTSREANYDAILHQNDITVEFSKESLAVANAAAQEEPILGNRLDLRDWTIFTIDGADAKDLDDAISIQKTESGYLLGVHIADVSHYVQANTPLDKEAMQRGTSVYFADKVVPMLPKILSNGVCSLHGGVDRYALSALINLDKRGKIETCNVHETIIRSKVRGVYSELNDLCEKQKQSEFYPKYETLFPDVFPVALELYHILDTNAKNKGALELETTESKIILGEDGMPVDIIKRERGLTECLIEQFMLCANEAVANWLYWQDMPCVYRIHEDPSAEKIQNFSVFAHNLGLDITPLRGKNIYPANFQQILVAANEKGLGSVVSFILLRSLMKARYSETASPHFGLAIERYCHFTSPIRRYPDLSVHRIVKTVLHGNVSEKTVQMLANYAQKTAESSSEREMCSVQAERDIEDLYKALYLYDHVGEEFDGVISSVMQFGFFVELDNTCEGLVPIATLTGYFTYDEKNMQLYCGKRSYKLGDKVRIQLNHVDIITRKVDMILAK